MRRRRFIILFSRNIRTTRDDGDNDDDNDDDDDDIYLYVCVIYLYMFVNNSKIIVWRAAKSAAAAETAEVDGKRRGGKFVENPTAERETDAPRAAQG